MAWPAAAELRIVKDAKRGPATAECVVGVVRGNQIWLVLVIEECKSETETPRMARARSGRLIYLHTHPWGSTWYQALRTEVEVMLQRDLSQSR
jgi:hypothetical protein